ncbi:MAG: hypothetical protein HZA10_04025 [Nitrospirae bacterium]|nr:hypothetical protein [Nitrospirota bacterium]
MKANVLVKDGQKYGGNYVATISFTNKKVISIGPDPVKVHSDAVLKGFKDPVIVFIPKRGMTNVY